MKIARIEMSGVKELDAKLAAIGKEVATKIGTQAIKASAERLAKEWETQAPYRPGTRKKYWSTAGGTTQSAYYGHLRENIKIRKVDPDKATAIVFGVTTGNAFWSHFLEFGTVRQPARPWARPIVERMKGELVNIQVDVLRVGIERAARSPSTRFGPVNTTGRNA